MGSSIEPFGDLSGDEEVMEARVSAFLFSNVSIASVAAGEQEENRAGREEELGCSAYRMYL